MRHAGPCRGAPGSIREQKEQEERVDENFTVSPPRKTKQDRISRLVRAKLLQSCPTLCDPMDGSPPGSSVQGFSRQEYWEWVAMPSPPRDLPDQGIEPVSLTSPTLACRFFTTSTTWEA